MCDGRLNNGEVERLNRVHYEPTECRPDQDEGDEPGRSQYQRSEDALHSATE